MQTIFYSLAGEGLGHLSRTLALVERLPARVHLLTWGEAYQYLQNSGYPYLHKIPGLPFGRNRKNQIDLGRTLRNFLKFLKDTPQAINQILALIEQHQPQLCISDFEGLLPRAAHQKGLPLLSIDNQHKFSRCTSEGLPWRLQGYAGVMGWFTEQLVTNPDLSIVSTFYDQKIKKKYPETVLTSCFVRSELEHHQPTRGDYLFVYYKPVLGRWFLDLLMATGSPIKMYGGDPYPGIEQYPVGHVSFAENLAGCRAVFSAAGNQLLGEAFYFGKPLFVVPEINQPEQKINGYYLEMMKAGVACEAKELSMAKIKAFLETEWDLSARPENGVTATLQYILPYLERHAN